MGVVFISLCGQGMPLHVLMLKDKLGELAFFFQQWVLGTKSTHQQCQQKPFPTKTVPKCLQQPKPHQTHPHSDGVRGHHGKAASSQPAGRSPWGGHVLDTYKMVHNRSKITIMK